MDLKMLLVRRRRPIAVVLFIVFLANCYFFYFSADSIVATVIRFGGSQGADATRSTVEDTSGTTAAADLYPREMLGNMSRTGRGSRIKPHNYDPASAWTPLNGRRPRGSIWPMPRHQRIIKSKLVVVDITKFRFAFTSISPTGDSDVIKACDVVSAGLERYEKLIREQFSAFSHKYAAKSRVVTSVDVFLTSSKCDRWPQLHMNESYQINSDADKIMIQSDSSWGILRGLETFSQMLWTTSRGQVVAYEAKIIDYPRFTHRGILVDTARHFLRKETILKNLDAMSYNKMNVMHWHMVDDQSFSYFSQTFPELSYMGAYDPFSKIYTPRDVADIVEYARLRGIRVVPEFDTPGHSLSWGKSHPELLTTCNENHQMLYGPMNPTNEQTYHFMDKFLSEIRNVFHDEFVHLGGDEVDHTCWVVNSKIRDWMFDKEIRFPEDLVDIYMTRLFTIAKNHKIRPIVWHEAFNNQLDGFMDTVVQVWDQSTPEHTLRLLTSRGYDVLVSYPWYLDHLRYGESWIKMYEFEPLTYSDGIQQTSGKVLGGEACMWGEYFDDTNVLQGIWPRTSAVAERLWSSSDVMDVEAASPRIYKQRCRMISRGIPAHPTRTGVCT